MAQKKEKLSMEDKKWFDSYDDLIPFQSENRSNNSSHSIIRKKEDRKIFLKGYSCEDCYDYYKNLSLSEEKKIQLMQNCSRHRDKDSSKSTNLKPPSSPKVLNIEFMFCSWEAF